MLEAAGFSTIGDLVRHLPLRWEQRGRRIPIGEIENHIGRAVTLEGVLVSAHAKSSPVRRIRVFEATLEDQTGQITLVWFNQPWLRDKLSRGDRLTVFGQPRISNNMHLQLENPDWVHESPGEDSSPIRPVYGSIAGLKPALVGRLVASAIERAADTDPIPDPIREQLGVSSLTTSLVTLHHPEELEKGRPIGEELARRRLVLEEFLSFQLALLVKRDRSEDDTSSAAGRSTIDAVADPLIERLPWSLTDAQTSALDEILEDLRAAKPMYRLLQGDVGSGKTIVAMIAAAAVIGSGRQVAFLAPTGILAEQLHSKAREFLDDSARIEILTGGTSPRERRRILSRLGSGQIDLLVGTHALLEDDVSFGELGLVVVDEQHRFGVRQRRKLVEKGSAPNVLVMSATPIPRSLAISMFADLDLSVIDQIPPGRSETRTEVRGRSKLPRIYDFLEREIGQGGQAFVVFPLVDASEEIDASAVTEEIEGLRRRFRSRRVDLLHGQMRDDEKEEIMRRFAAGEIDILAATTIIEVGIDVPRATVMLIIDADRLGLSQLHQLRGRVGRGERQGWCILVRNERASEPAKKRLRQLAETADGFEVARLDLKTRGFGEVFGTRQSGAPKFRIGDPIEDEDLMTLARDVARSLIHTEGLEACRKLAEQLLGPRFLKPSSRD